MFMLGLDLKKALFYFGLGFFIGLFFVLGLGFF